MGVRETGYWCFFVIIWKVHAAIAEIGSKRGESIQDMVESIANEGRSFSKETKQADDTTILALRIRKGLEEKTAEFQTSGAHSADAQRHG